MREAHEPVLLIFGAIFLIVMTIAYVRMLSLQGKKPNVLSLLAAFALLGMMDVVLFTSDPEQLWQVFVVVMGIIQACIGVAFYFINTTPDTD